MPKQTLSKTPTVRGKYGMRVPALYLMPQDTIEDKKQVEQKVIGFHEPKQSPDNLLAKESVFQRFIFNIRPSGKRKIQTLTDQEKHDDYEVHLRDVINDRQSAEQDARKAKALQQKAEATLVRVSARLKDTERMLGEVKELNRLLIIALDQERVAVSQARVMIRNLQLPPLKSKEVDYRLEPTNTQQRCSEK